MKELLFVFVFATSSVLAGVLKDEVKDCSFNEFLCSDGACVSMDRFCDGRRDCADGSDESTCNLGSNNLFDEPIIHRYKRQSGCGGKKSKWRCRDGSCIDVTKKCDGVADCPDLSDETHGLCRNISCQSNWFRCTYGACVDGTAACNGEQDCADNSDELLPACRSEKDEVGRNFKCQDGTQIPVGDKCDGVTNCPDGSDETVRTCAAVKCQGYLFQCAYGACVDQGSDCDGKIDCADGSDEAEDLCGDRIGPRPQPTPTIPVTNKPSSDRICELPPYPNHGGYLTNFPNAKPGDKYDFITVNFTCQDGYGIQGVADMYCFEGGWQHEIPKCIRLCKLTINNPAVDYWCVVPKSNGGTRPCNPFEPSGTIVYPKCRRPNYYSQNEPPTMRCIDGVWDYSANCVPECGTVTPEAEQLIINGVSAKYGELPWHVGIFTKNSIPYMQICGGSIISSTLVISAAHCFWNDLTVSSFPPSDYAVGAGKRYRPWNEKNDPGAQKTDVSDLKMPESFLGQERNFADDIALVFVSQPFIFKTYLRPVCLSFDEVFEATQLVEGNLGKVAGWGLTGANGPASTVLKAVELPFIKPGTCIAKTPVGYREHITSEKFCAGYDNGTALCKGDSGGGLAFPSEVQGKTRYFLRGIVSTSPKSVDMCNAVAITSFTQVSKQHAFIRQYYSPY